MSLKKVLSFLAPVIPRDGFYLTYSWHAPLNEAGCDAAKQAARSLRSRAKIAATSALHAAAVVDSNFGSYWSHTF